MREANPGGDSGDPERRDVIQPAAPAGGGASTPSRAGWRRPAVLLAIALDAVVVIVALVLLANGGSPVMLALAAILGFAPWAAIIDHAERPRRR